MGEKPGHRVVVSTMKNEGPFILEWVAHQKALGFDEIVVCTNDCEDTTVGILKRLEQMGIVHHHETRVGRGGIHRSALRQAFRKDVVRSADWIFVCDVDEFLNIHVGDGSVDALIEQSPDADVIAVPWRVFGPANVTLYRDRLVTRQFRLAEAAPDVRPEAGKFVKSLFRGPERFKRMGLHTPIPADEHAKDIRMVYPGGTPFITGGERSPHRPSFEVAQVNHYALRSLDSFLVKRARGRANHMRHVLGRDYWDRFDLNDVRDDSIARYDAAVERWLAEFKADPRLARLHRRAVRWHNWKARMQRRDPEVRPVWLQIREEMVARGQALEVAPKAAA